MENGIRLSAKGGADSVSKPIRQGLEKAAETGRYVAEVQATAMEQSYREAVETQTALFIQRHVNETPGQVGRSAAIFKMQGARDAMLGLLWRVGLIGGTGFASCLYMGLGLGIAACTLIVTLPLCCVLTLY